MRRKFAAAIGGGELRRAGSASPSIKTKKDGAPQRLRDFMFHFISLVENIQKPYVTID